MSSRGGGEAVGALGDSAVCCRCELVCVVVRTSSCHAKLSKLAAAARPKHRSPGQTKQTETQLAREGAWTLPHGNSRKRHICIYLRVLQQHQSRDSPPQHSLHRRLPASYTLQIVAKGSYVRFAFQRQPSGPHLTSRRARTAQLRAGHFRRARRADKTRPRCLAT